MDVAIASCVTLPEADTDAEPLAAAFARAAIDARALAWDDPAAPFAEARVTVIRSTWNYPERPEAFAAWVETTARTTELWNRAPTVRWNLHKGYLLDLERAGVHVVPTRLVRRGDGASLDSIARELAASELVVKPATSCGSRGTMRVRSADRARGEAHLRDLVANEDALVQPFVASVEGYGERALVWIDGVLTHAVRKAPRFIGDAEAVSEAMPIAKDEAELAERAIAAAPGPLLYGRVDMARDEDGRPMLMELELIEPSLFFAQSAAALERYVRAVKRRLG
jgi:hypothetical protein